MELQRICVFGAGAVGGHLAAKLAAAGHDVSVVARGANLEAIRSNGIALREGTRPDARTIAGRVRASDRPADLGAQDVVFVTTKATALGALAQAAPLLSDASTVFVFV
ncbi:MAG: ketopantoate reductase family protein, partial [Pseudolabrys sp.]